MQILAGQSIARFIETLELKNSNSNVVNITRLAIIHDLSEYRHINDDTRNLFSSSCSTWRVI